LKLKHRGPNGNRNLLEMKKTSNGRRPQNTQQPLIGSSSINLRGPKKKGKLLVIKTALSGRRPQNIKSAISYQPHIESSTALNLILGDHIKIENYCK
jgi:hypothetical protein